MTEFVEPTTDEIITVLIGARDIISKGWCRGDYKKGDRYCTTGAIYKVSGYKFEKTIYGQEVLNEDGTYYASDGGLAEAVMSELCGSLGFIDDDDWLVTSLPAWNDSQKSKKPVLELFDKTIERLSN